MTNRDSATDDARPMNLLDFARLVKDGSKLSDDEFYSLALPVLPLGDLWKITREEAEWLFQALDWMRDVALLVHEFHEYRATGGNALLHEGNIFLPGGSGPWVSNITTREDVNEPNFGLVLYLSKFGAVQ